MERPANFYDNFVRQMTAGELEHSGFVCTRGHDYNIFKFPADVSEAKAHHVR